MSRPRIGIDLGGTKTEIVALAPDGEVLVRDRAPTPPSYTGTLDAIVELVRRVEAEVGPASVGLGIPGAISPATGVVKNANSTWLIGHPLDRDLEERLERPIRVTNDANCFALSEAADGAGAGAAVVFGVILGTGVGGGLVVDGRVVDGPQRIGGEWGHNPLPWPKDEERPGPECYCGRRGCMETWVSGPGMEADHARESGETLESELIVAAAESGDADAIATIGRYVDRVARGLATVVNVVDPDVIVLGGGMSNLPDLAQRVEVALAPYVFTDECTTPVRSHVHGDASGVRGAAWLWPTEEG